MTTEKNIKDYLHLYLGCNSNHGKLVGITEHAHVYVEGELFTCAINDIKPILRPLSDMTEEEAIEVVEIIIPLRQRKTKRVFRQWGHLKEVSIMGGSKFEHCIVINPVNGEIYETTGAGRNSVGSLPKVYHYLLAKHFDLFNLIEAGLAIDAKTTNKI